MSHAVEASRERSRRWEQARRPHETPCQRSWPRPNIRLGRTAPRSCCRAPCQSLSHFTWVITVNLGDVRRRLEQRSTSVQRCCRGGWQQPDVAKRVRRSKVIASAGPTRRWVALRGPPRARGSSDDRTRSPLPGDARGQLQVSEPTPAPISHTSSASVTPAVSTSCDRVGIDHEVLTQRLVGPDTIGVEKLAQPARLPANSCKCDRLMRLRGHSRDDFLVLARGPRLPRLRHLRRRPLVRATSGGTGRGRGIGLDQSRVVRDCGRDIA